MKGRVSINPHKHNLRNLYLSEFRNLIPADFKNSEKFRWNSVVRNSAVHSIERCGGSTGKGHCIFKLLFILFCVRKNVKQKHIFEIYYTDGLAPPPLFPDMSEKVGFFTPSLI